MVHASAQNRLWPTEVIAKEVSFCRKLRRSPSPFATITSAERVTYQSHSSTSDDRNSSIPSVLIIATDLANSLRRVEENSLKSESAVVDRAFGFSVGDRLCVNHIELQLSVWTSCGDNLPVRSSASPRSTLVTSICAVVNITGTKRISWAAFG